MKRLLTKLFIGMLMLQVGAVGLGATLCGVFAIFSGSGLQGVGMGILFGIIPGILFLWGLKKLYLLLKEDDEHEDSSHSNHS